MTACQLFRAGFFLVFDWLGTWQQHSNDYTKVIGNTKKLAFCTIFILWCGRIAQQRQWTKAHTLGISQPHSQGFSLFVKKGKALGTRLCISEG